MTDIVEELLQPWSAEFALQPKTASERFDVIYIQELRRQAAEEIKRLRKQVEYEKMNTETWRRDAESKLADRTAAYEEIARLRHACS